MLKENKREEITKNIEKGEALVEQVADGIWRIGVELPQNPLRELNSYLIKGKENERDLLIDTGFRREECRAEPAELNARTLPFQKRCKGTAYFDITKTFA